MAADYTQDANCKGAWFMTANGGNETDASVNGETLTETGGTIPTSATVPSGYGGTSRDFEAGDTEYLTHADGGSTDISGVNQAISYMGWFKFESAAANYGLIVKADSNLDHRGYKIRFNSATGDVRVFISGDGTSTTQDSVISTSTDYGDGNWHHIAVVSNDTDIRIYRNGVLDCTPVAHDEGVFNNSAPFVVGSDWDVGAAVNFFDGLITEVAVFDRALSAAEILEIYENGLDGTKGAGFRGRMTTRTGYWGDL